MYRTRKNILYCQITREGRQFENATYHSIRHATGKSIAQCRKRTTNRGLARYREEN
jgi:hypothetical protein